MEVTEIRIKLVGNRDEKLQAFCTLTLDNCFVVRDVKVIKGSKGAFVAMPSRKLSDSCPKCHGKNHLRAHFCNDCGYRLAPDRAQRDEKGRSKLHADIAHPIHQEYRDHLSRLILAAYEKELLLAQQPDYKPPSDEFPEDDRADFPADESEEAKPAPPPPPPHTKDQQHHRFGEGLLP
jgi:stage V sporulation protein G